ncbi:MAG TPA: MASE3 domain-containing protein, partial [Chloroflexota bacterium]|nr:MASE3 domain-containing protein [Chloroflexota bacterium]
MMLASAFVHPEREGIIASRKGLLVMNLVGSAVPLLLFTYWSQALPLLASPDGELTPLKYGLEYVIIGGMLAGAVAHYANPIGVRDEPRGMVVAALVVSALGEMPFTVGVTSFNIHLLVGHLLKALSYYLVFRALLVTSVRRPYVQLRIANDSLEETVSELDSRNRELDALVDVAITLTGSLNPSQVLRSAIDKATKVMGARAGAIFLRDEDSNRLRLVAWEGLPQEMVDQFVAVPPMLRTSFEAPGAGGGTSALDDKAVLRSLGGGRRQDRTAGGLPLQPYR